MHQTLVNAAATASTILAVYCTIPYIRSILNGKTKPHQLSWLVFSIMNGIVLVSQFLAGGRQSVLIALVFFVSSTADFILSLKYGTRNTSKWDRLLFVSALVTIIIWVLTRSNSAAIWLTVLIDIAATAMIILKIKADPRSEAPYPWAILTVAYVFTCLTLAAKPLGILYVRPYYGLLSGAAVVAAIWVFRTRGA